MSDVQNTPGPIRWAPIEELIDTSPGRVFEDLLARAVLDAPDLAGAIDTARLAATPVDPADLDGRDDQDLVDGAAELAGAARRVRELQPIDELGALDGLSPEIDAGALEIPEDDGLPHFGPEDAPTPPGDRPRRGKDWENPIEEGGTGGR